MTYQDDPNLRTRDTRRVDRDGSRNGLMLAVIAAVVVIGGLLVYTMSGHQTTTASNESPAVTRQTNPSNPAPAPATPPAKSQ